MNYTNPLISRFLSFTLFFQVYCKIKEDIKAFFIDNGISHITIQPEFFNKNASTDSIMNKMFSNCLFSCQEEGCKKSHCCPEYSQVKFLNSLLFI